MMDIKEDINPKKKENLIANFTIKKIREKKYE